MTRNQKLNNILSYFGETYPLQIKVFGLFKWKDNRKVHYIFRTYDDIIEYNPRFVEELSEDDIYNDLRLLSARIFLGHPYRAIPEGVSPYHAAEFSEWEIIKKLNLSVEFRNRKFYESLSSVDDYILAMYRSECDLPEISGKETVSDSIYARMCKKFTVIAYTDQAALWHDNPEQYNKILDFIEQMSTRDEVRRRNAQEALRESYFNSPSHIGPWEPVYRADNSWAPIADNQKLEYIVTQLDKETLASIDVLDDFKKYYEECWATLKADFPSLKNVPIPELIIIKDTEEVPAPSCYVSENHRICFQQYVFEKIKEKTLPWEQVQDMIWHELTHVLVHNEGHSQRFWDILDKYGPIGKKINAYKAKRALKETKKGKAIR